MFGNRRKTHSELVRSELGESFEHFKAAAGHAAGGVGTAVRPRVETARGFVVPPAAKARDLAGSGWESTRSSVAPLAAAAGQNARQAARAARKGGRRRDRQELKADRRAQRLLEKATRKSTSSGRRWPIVAAILVAGAAFGAAAVMRRRRQQQWDEYDPSRSLDAARNGGSPTAGGSHALGDKLGSAAGAAKSSVRSAASTAKGAASTAREKAGQRFSSTSQSRPTSDPTARPDNMTTPNGHA